MKIILTGVETNNKGAELMLYAILQEIERKHPESSVYIEKDRVNQGENYIQTSLKLITIQNPIMSIINFFHINGILWRLHIPPIVTYTKIPEVDYLLDGSGLHFTDSMVTEESRNYWSQLFNQVKRYKAKIIFLPQGFGPLEKKETQESVKILFDNADLVFAREHVSFDYLNRLDTIDNSKLKMYSDFTSLVEGKIPSGYEYLKGAVCVIPNMQMVNKKVVKLDEYISYLEKIINVVSNMDKQVYLLNHQGQEDEKLLAICKKRFGTQIEVVTGLNALETKGLISTAYMVISSRFHGVASALNSCVPCLATSWSHKYQCLFEDYGQNDCILTISDMDADVKKIESFLDSKHNLDVREQLQSKIPQIRQQTEDMWRMVWSV